MVQIIPPNPADMIWSQVGQAIGSGLGKAYERGQEQEQRGKLASLLFGPEEAKKYGNIKSEDLLKVYELQNKAPTGGVTSQSTPPEVGMKIKEIINQNPDATSDELAIQLDEAGVPRAFSNSYIENRRRKEELETKRDISKEQATRKELVKTKEQIVEKATAAREGIRNKNQLMSIIDRNNLDDPTYAAFAENLPFNLGKRLLSEDTVAYKAGLVDEFRDLKTIFKGQTRTKELDILEKKIADTYYTDSQKKAILKSRVNALKADIIREEAAAEVEEKYPNLGLLQFSKKVEEIAKPKLDALFDSILDEQKAIIDQAERKKKIPLDLNDPEDYQIVAQIMKEAGGNRNKAREIARKKGYNF